jgi:3-hydroxybutyryl-CoA dehydrogenase
VGRAPHRADRPASARARRWQRLHDEALGEITASLGALAQLGAMRADQVDAIAARVRWCRRAARPLRSSRRAGVRGVPERLDAKREAFAQLNRLCAPTRS